MTPKPKTVLYVRVSTAEQTSEHQVTQAEQEGFAVDRVIVDHGISGVSTRLGDRPQGRRLFDLLQSGDTLVVRWVNRLGRDYTDVKKTIEGFNAAGVTVKTVISRMTFEADHNLEQAPQKAARDAMLAFMAAMAEAEATAAREARRAGIAHAKAAPDASRKYRGKKPSYDRRTFDTVRAMLADGTHTVTAIAREAGLSRQAVLRIRDDADGQDAALSRWGM